VQRYIFYLIAGTLFATVKRYRRYGQKKKGKDI